VLAFALLKGFKRFQIRLSASPQVLLFAPTSMVTAAPSFVPCELLGVDGLLDPFDLFFSLCIRFAFFIDAL